MIQIIYKTPQLVSTTSKGLKKFWQGKVLYDGNYHYTSAEYSQLLVNGESSLVQESVPTLVKRKNIGKKNETSSKDQAISEINSDYMKKRDKGYTLEGEKIQSLPLPMLAHEYKKRKHTLPETVYLQPKLDGMRALYDGNQMWSRGGKPLLEEVVEQFKLFDNRGEIIDGELMLPKDVGTFSQTMSACKKFGPLTSKLKYYIFDLVSDEPFPARYERLKQVISENGFCPNVELVPTIVVPNVESEIFKYHTENIVNGFEGTMVRSGVGGYVVKDRTVQILKLKDFEDAEFEIVGSKEGVGRDAGLIVFVCKVGDQTFDCRPDGPNEERAKMWAIRDSFLHKMLTVRYQEMSEYGVPRFPVGKGIRDD